MMRTSQPTDFVVSVEGVGDFTFGRRVIVDQFKIERAYLEYTGDFISPVSFFGRLATSMADLKVLTVKAPDGWDLDGLDPLDPASYERVEKVWGELRTAEARFRGRVPQVVQAARQGDVGNA